MPNGDTNSTTSTDGSTLDLLDAERRIRRQLADDGINFSAEEAVANIFRAATAVRRRAERQLLASHDLSWGGFTVLFVLWIWGDMRTADLAEEVGVAKGTLSGLMTTLEKRGAITRTRDESDGRKVVVALTAQGANLIETLFPQFHQHELDATHGLSDQDQRELARLLRIVTSNATG